MPDCLVLVERGGKGSIDIVATGYQEAVMNALQRIRNSYPAEIEPFCFQENASENTPNKSVEMSELQLSLTSIVLATSLYRSGVDFIIYDDEDLIEKYRSQLESQIESSIKYVCISTTFLTDLYSLKRMISFFHDRDRDIRVILGGQLLLIWGERAFEELDNVFCYCYGDMDHDFGEIIADLLDSRKPEDLLTKVSKNDKSFYTVTKNISDLNTIVLPDWGLLKKINFNDNYYADNPLPERIPVEERRGCVFRCAFCSYHTLNKHRQKSPARIVEELKNLKKLGYKKVNFTGAEFIAPPKKCRETLKLIIEAGLGFDILASARIDLLSKHPAIIDLMVEAGFTKIYFGVESGDQTILKNMNKRFNLKNVSDVIERLKKNNIDVWASFIFGFPGETDETVQNTIKFINESNFSTLDLHVLAVVVGTPLDVNRKKFNLKTLGNIWSHSTMSLRDMPDLMKEIFVKIHQNCDSTVIHIRDHLSKYIPQKNVSIKSSKAIDKYLHDLIYIEYNDGITTKEEHLLKVWNEMKFHIEYIPKFLLK